uniref:Uncharacterized protein n=1 Tax=Cruciviridae sp. TaxID=1955495 RepID=A0A1S6LVP3_9VIRU|nr:hypothetical protein [Cruciviridae sp.]
MNRPFPGMISRHVVRQCRSTYILELSTAASITLMSRPAMLQLYCFCYDDLIQKGIKAPAIFRTVVHMIDGGYQLNFNDTINKIALDVASHHHQLTKGDRK